MRHTTSARSRVLAPRRPHVLLALTMIVATTACAPPHALADKPPVAPVDFDLQGFIDQAIKDGSRRIVVPPGRYRVTPRNRQHLLLKDVQDVQIVADSVEMVCMQTTRALTLANCRNVTVRGLAIDYDPLPFTQGRIAAISEDKKTHEVKLFEGYPGAETVRAFKYEILRPDTRTLRCPDYSYTVEKVDARRIRVVKSRGRPNDPEQVGDLVVIGAEHAPGGSIPHAVELRACVNVRLESIDLFASNCFGFLEVNCEATTYERCRIDRRAPATDPVRRADPRLRSLNADAFHSKHAVKGPSLLQCVAKFMGDDALNICGDYHMITTGSGAEFRVLAKGRMNLAAGDPVELLAYDGTRLPDAKVVAVEADGKINEAEKAFLLKQRMDENLRTRWNASAYKVTLDRAVELPMGSLIASTRRMGNGFLVQGCDFGSNRSRGILIKASDGKIVDNLLTGTWGPAILVSPEYWWLESGSSNNVQITGNVIRDCPAVGIAVQAHGGQGQLAPAGAHNRITITGNTLTGGPRPNIYVTSTDDLRIEHNTCTPAANARPAWGSIDPAKAQAIMTVNCTREVVAENTVK